VLFLAAIAGLPAQRGLAEDWPQFRGPRGNGIASEKNVPTTWSKDENVLWRVDLPSPGNSSPIVSRGRVFVTISSKDGKSRGLRCYDCDGGELLWEKSVDFDGRDITHGQSCFCPTTPACDGSRVVVWHSSAGMYCYDYEGQELWKADLGPFLHIWGYGASPILYEDLVINNCGPGERTFLVALNKYTGDKVWQTDEPGGHSGEGEQQGQGRKWIGSWSTPVLARVADKDQVVVSYPHHVKAYDPRTGEVLWQCEGLSDLVYTTALVGDGVGVAMSGFHGPAMGFKLGGSGNVTESNRLWRVAQRMPQRIGSGVIVGGDLFMANEQGVVQCIDVMTGKDKWPEQRLNAEGALWASLVLADGKLYVTTKRGETAVFAANPEKFEPIATNAVGEPSDSTIAVSDGRIYLRTHRGLWCIGEKK
jgi:outer membrane protein assembly factor BamB